MSVDGSRSVGVRATFSLAWPIMVSLLSFNLMSLADTLFVAQLGTAPLAAMGLAVPLWFTMLSLGFGTLGAVRVAVAQKTGAGEPDAVRRLAWQGLWLALSLGVGALLLLPLGPTLFQLLRASSETAGPGLAYFTVRLAAAPISLVSAALGGWFQGRGDTRTPMVAVVLGNALNIALDPVAIFVLGLGVGGAALASVVAEAVALTVLLWRVLPVLRSTPARLDRPLLRLVADLGLPMGTKRTLDCVGWLTFVALLSAAGDVDIAAHVVVIRIVGTSFLPGAAIGEATSVLVGQAIGGGRVADARTAWRSGLVLAMGVMSTFAVLFVAFPGMWLAPFPAGEEVHAVAGHLLRMAALFQVFDAVATVSLCSLNGAGDTRFTLGLALVGTWLVNLPLAAVLVLGLGLGVEGAWGGLTLEIASVALIAGWRVRGGSWLSERRMARVRARLGQVAVATA